MRKPFRGILSKAAGRNMRYAMFGAFALAVAISGVSAVSEHQDKAATELSAATAKGPQLAPEMQKLGFYLGDWDYTEKYEKSDMVPNGAQNSGVYSSTAGPGGNSLVQHFHSQGPAGDFEGLIVMTWDPKEKQYKGYIFGNDFPGCVVQTGQFENGVLVFRSEFSMGGKTMGLRYTAKFMAPNKLEAAEYMSSGGGPEVLLMKVDATKR
jgi:hypothetical protein